MKLLQTCIISLCCTLAFTQVVAQRGLPPKEKTRSTSVTKYAQHLDFLPPIDFKFFGTNAGVPDGYNGDGLVCWHGSWNRSKPAGFKVQRIRFENGVAVGADDFLTGFLKPGFLMFKRKARFGRPAGICFHPDGSVYISDDANGVIYAITRKTEL